MANRIKRSDIAEEDLFKSIRDSAKQTIKSLEQMNKSLQTTAKTLKKTMSGTGLGSSKEINAMTTAIQKANKVKQESVKISKSKQQAEQNLAKSEAELLRIERERIKNDRESLRNAILIKKEKERELKIKARLIKANKKENTEYGKLVRNTRDLKNQSKELAAQLLKLEQSGKRNSREWIKLSQSYKQTTLAARQGDAALKKIDSTVGDNFRNVGNYAGALNTLKNGLMQMGLAVGGFQILRKSMGVVADFDQATADLAAISGKTKDELQGLNKQAKELGATTQFTATEITNMQIELAKLGFTTQQITASTEGVSSFAAATGADIPEAAALAGSALRGFNLDATEMDRVVSTLGVATTKSALDFSKLQTSLSKVAPVANAMGFSIEDTTALLGQLANAGFDASMMGTATKNILLKLADANGDLAKKLGGPVKNADELAAGLKKLSDEGINLTEALELTDKRSVAAFNTFMTGADTMVSLRDSITDVDKELQDMADKRLDSINGQLTLLNSAWEGWLLNLNETSGAGSGVKTFIGFLAENLSTIMNSLFKLIRAFVLYKGILIATTIVQKAYNMGLKGSVKWLFSTKRATDGAAVATTRLGRAMKTVPWLMIIGLVVELATSFYEAATGADELAAAQQRLANAQQAAQKLSEIKDKEIKDRIKTQIQEIDLLNAKDEISDKEAIKRKKKLYYIEARGIQEEIRLKKISLQETENRLKSSEKIAKAIREGKINLGGSKEQREEIAATIKRVEKSHIEDPQRIATLTEEIKALNEIKTDLNDTEKDYNLQLLQSKKRTHSYNHQTGKTGKHIKRINTELKTQINLHSQLNDLLSKQASILKSIRDIEAQQKAEAIRLDFESEFDIQVENAKKLGEFSMDNLLELNKKKTDILLAQIDDEVKTSTIAEETKHKNKFDSLRSALINERNLLLAQDGITQDQRDIINAQYDTKKKELDILEENAAEVLQDKLTLIEAKGEKQRTEIVREGTDEIIEVRKELEDNVNDHKEKKDDESLKKERQNFESRKAIAKMFTDYMVRQSNERIKLIDQEIQAAEKQADFLRDLAVNGNIDAKASLAEQNRIIAEANKKKEAELRRQQRIKLAESVYSTYNQKLADDSKNPLADTIRDTTMLQAFINTLPTFADGTEDTGVNGRGIDGKGGFLSILHPNERVVPKSENAMIGDITNSELANIANEYNTGKLISAGATQIGTAWQSQLIVDHLIKVQNAIENRPETNIELEDIVNGAMTIARQTKKGNSVTYNRYKVK